MLKDAVQSKPNIDVVKLQKSEGVVLRNSKYRQKTRSFRIKVSFIFLNRICPTIPSTLVGTLSYVKVIDENPKYSCIIVHFHSLWLVLSFFF